VAVVRGYVPEDMIDIALSKQGIDIGRAPPYGLMLEEVSNLRYCIVKIKSI